MQRTSIYLLLIVLKTVIEAGVITNGADLKTTLEIKESSKAEIVDEKHKFQLPKNYMKIHSTDPFINIQAIQQSAVEKKFVPKNMLGIKNKSITRKPQELKVDSTLNGTDFNETHIPNVNAYENISFDTNNKDFIKNMSTEDQTDLYAVEISINEGKLTDFSDQENRVLNEEKNVQNPTLVDFLRAGFLRPTEYDVMEENTEEKFYLEEFIFLEELNDSSDAEDYDMTTEFFVDESRFKRSINIIEEENLGTTASEFKYTAQDARLSNDLFFKNINS